MPDRPAAEFSLALRRSGGFRLAADFEVFRHGITGLFGPSGCGKTTLLRSLAGLEPGATGRVQVAGSVWQDSGAGIFLPPWQRPAGLVFQEPRLFPHLDVAGNLAFGARHASGSEAMSDELLDALGLGDMQRRRVSDLSGGEQRRVGLARVLARQPDILLLDEPLTGLDAASRAQMLGVLAAVQGTRRLPVVYVSHDLDEVTQLCDDVVVMRNGQTVHAGSLVQLLGDPRVFGADQTGVLIETSVAGHDLSTGLTRLHLGDSYLSVPGKIDGPQVRVRILARDVSLALSEAADTSILNRLPANIETIDVENDHAYLRLRCGPTWLLSQVSRFSLQQLELQPGQAVIAQIKGVAVRQTNKDVR